jgi:hypothetical protein
VAHQEHGVCAKAFAADQAFPRSTVGGDPGHIMGSWFERHFVPHTPTEKVLVVAVFVGCALLAWWLFS